MYRQFVDPSMLDITHTPIEVAPTAHHSMGGVWVDATTHATDVEGRWAVSKSATGTHGANRLGGNSLGECLVFGRVVGREAAAWSASLDVQVRDRDAIAAARDEVDALLAQRGGEDFPRALQRGVRDLMSAHAGVVRSEAGLDAGLAELDALEARLGTMEVRPDIAGFDDLVHAVDLKGSISPPALDLAARATLECARRRRETRGAHHRSDFAEQDRRCRSTSPWRPGEPVARVAVGQPSAEVAALWRRGASSRVRGRLLE